MRVGVADHHLVRFVDDAVVVLILPLDVTGVGAGPGEGLTGVVVNLLLGLEEPLRLEPVPRANGLAFHDHEVPADVRPGPDQINDLVSVVREVEIDAVAKCAGPIVPAERELPAAVLHYTGVLRGRSAPNDVRDRQVEEDVFGPTQVVVARERQAVGEERGVDADVRRRRGLPRNVLVGEFGLGRAGLERAAEVVGLIQLDRRVVLVEADVLVSQPAP